MIAFGLAMFVSVAGAAPVRKSWQEPVFTSVFPGFAKGARDGDSYVLANEWISFKCAVRNGKLSSQEIAEVGSGEKHPFDSAFRLTLARAQAEEGAPSGQGNLSAEDFVIKSAPRLERIIASPNSVKPAERRGGWRITANLECAAVGMEAQWFAELRDGAHYVRTVLKLSGSRGVLTGVRTLDFAARDARQIGTAVAGNPAATETLFAGMELPMGKNECADGRIRAGVSCQLPLESGAIYQFGSVVGVYPEHQLRRAFLAYLELERAAPARPFLHYNGWFDFDRNVTEKGMLETVAAYDRELIRKRGVPVRAFVVDDGWDDWDAGFWAINRRKFPSGFTNLGAALENVGSRFGIWISPLAGYDHSDQRIALAAEDGLTRNGAKTLDLSFPPYYKWFLQKCAGLIRNDKTAYFKFDKAGNGVSPHFLALLRLCGELRAENPELMINITVGTWPSPYWLNAIDCTWRGGNDMGFEGPGDEREKWITYRDAQTWRGVVSKAPLYPLNSIMVHGIVLSDGHSFARQALKGGTEMRHEVRSFFGSGTTMQELYVKPAITPAAAWDAIAESARWAQANADILVDTHWIGGDPSGGANVYGWAAWAPRGGIVTLRNPSDSENAYTLEIGAAFELPVGLPSRFTVKSAYADTPAPFDSAEAGHPVSITLKPFEVLVLEFAPARR